MNDLSAEERAALTEAEIEFYEEAKNKHGVDWYWTRVFCKELGINFPKDPTTMYGNFCVVLTDLARTRLRAQRAEATERKRCAEVVRSLAQRVRTHESLAEISSASPEWLEHAAKDIEG